LRDAGYCALLVGGCVRDLMLGREPKDFDVVTDAKPEEIRKLFSNARLIGRRFRLAHVRYGRDVIEVATFRAIPQLGKEDEEEGEPEDESSMARGPRLAPIGESADGPSMARGPRLAPIGESVRSEEGFLLRDNVFGTQEEDALRRDFTVNALYYNIRDKTVMDYMGGAQDLQRALLRMIGDPATRYREDPVRMLRAVRFAAKLGFQIEPATEKPIRELAGLLADVPPARMFEEVLKLFHGGAAAQTYELLRHYGLFQYLFPQTDRALATQDHHFPRVFVAKALSNTDARINMGKPVTPAFLFATLLWEPVRVRQKKYLADGRHPYEALQHASDEVLREQLKSVMLPKRFSVPMREIWAMQSKFERRSGKQAYRLFEHPRFRAAYDFLLLRGETGEVDPELGVWWTRFQEVSIDEREGMTQAVAPPAGEPGRKRSRRRRRRKGSAPPS
jgi:poly(A) polymerase